VPHHATVGLLEYERALGDGKGRLDAEPDHTEIVAPDQFVRIGQFLARQPALTLPVHILPLILADRTRAPRLAPVGKLGAALLTSPQRHDGSSRPDSAEHNGMSAAARVPLTAGRLIVDA